MTPEELRAIKKRDADSYERDGSFHDPFPKTLAIRDRRALLADNEALRQALYYFIDSYIENNDDPSYTDPFWYLKDEPFYSVLQERVAFLADREKTT